MTVSRVPNVEGGIQPTIVTAKGDLITAVANANPARLGVGSDGQLLTADSTTATGLSYQNNFAAGKNKIINGDFRFNQRNFTSNTATGTFNFDRFQQFNSGATGTLTITPQVFTPGAAPVSGYEGRNFVQCVTAAGASTDTLAVYSQKIESVRTLAGQTATISFWAKAGTGTPKIGVEIEQYFGSGGSPSGTVQTVVGAVTLSTSWARYSVTVTVPSISGKTIGTDNSDSLAIYLWLSAGTTFASRASSIGLQNATFQMWGFQVEAGSTATAFQTATGTIQGELAACQRYLPAITGAGYDIVVSQVYSTTQAIVPFTFPVTPRVAPTGVTVTSATSFYLRNSTSGFIACTSITFNNAGLTGGSVIAVVASGVVAGNASSFLGNSPGLILFTGCEL
jgi:hypothetical protein